MFGAALPPSARGEVHYRDRDAESTSTEAPGAWVWYDPKGGALILTLGVPLRVDANQYYFIQSLNQDGFSGRWEDGGFASTLLSMPTGTALEHSRGYFCAFRISDTVVSPG